MGKEFKPLFNNVIVDVYEKNPYEKQVSGDELTMGYGEFENPDDGTIDRKDFYIQCAKVIEVGSECEYVEVGMDVFLDWRSLTPIPFLGNMYFMLNEQSIKAVVAEGLEEKFKK